MYKLEKYKHKLMHVNGGGGWLVSKVTDPYLNDVEQKQVYKREYLRLKQVGGAESEQGKTPSEDALGEELERLKDLDIQILQRLAQIDALKEKKQQASEEEMSDLTDQHVKLYSDLTTLLEDKKALQFELKDNKLIYDYVKSKVDELETLKNDINRSEQNVESEKHTSSTLLNIQKQYMYYDLLGNKYIYNVMEQKRKIKVWQRKEQELRQKLALEEQKLALEEQRLKKLQSDAASK